MEDLITIIDEKIYFYERILNKISKTQHDLSDNNSYIRTINNYILINETKSVISELKFIREAAEKIKNAKNS